MMAVKGWCPTLAAPMASGDGLLTRVRPLGGRLTAAQATGLARGAALHGNGIVELTNRGNLQFRGFGPAGAAAFAQAVLDLGLAHRDPAAEQVRNVMAAPLSARSLEAARAVEAALAALPGRSALPPKFSVAVDLGGGLPLGGTGADLSLVPASDMPCLSLAGSDLAAPAGDVGAAVGRLAAAFVALCAAGPSRPRRMAALVEEVGAEAVFSQAGLDPVLRRPAAAPPPPPGPAGRAFVLGVPLRQLDATGLAALADLACAAGDGLLHLTPWAAVVLDGIEDPGRLAAGAAALDLIVAPEDVRLRVAACPGAPACGEGRVAARADAARFAPLVPAGRLLHVSGCAKGCAHPGPADLVLVGHDGGYGFLRGGRASNTPTIGGLDPAAAEAILRGQG